MRLISPKAASEKLAAGIDLPRAAESPRSRTWLWLAGLPALVLLVSNLELLSGKAVPTWDSADFFGPSFSLISDHIRAHRLLMWNPWTSGGTPDFAEPELGTISPILLLTAALFPQPQTGVIVYWMLVWIAAGVGMMVLARHLGCPPWGAVIGALGFVASGFFLEHAQHITSLYSAAWLPWICWRFDDALLRKRYWSAIEAGVLYGLSALGGYPQFTILTPGFLGLWALGRVFFHDNGTALLVVPEKGGRRILSAAASLLLVGIISGLIFCPPYLAFLNERHGYSDRVGERARVESISSGLLPAGAITTLASPYLAVLNYPGLPGRLWPESDISMSGVYSGAVVSVLGLLALLQRSRWRRWMALIAAFFFCAALGNQLPLRGWLYDLVPPTRYFRNASMFSVYSIFIWCTLAALAARDLEHDADEKGRLAKKFLALSAVAATVAVISFSIVVHRFSAPPFRFNLAVVHLLVAWFGVVLCALLLFLRVVTVRRCAQMLVTVAVLDAGLAIVVSAPAMYTPDFRVWWQVMNKEHVSSLNLTSRGLYRQLHVPSELPWSDYPNNRNVPLKVPVLDSFAPMPNRFELFPPANVQARRLEGDSILPKFALGNDRIWFSEEAAQLAPTDAVYAQFKIALLREQKPPLIVHSPEQMYSMFDKRPASTNDGVDEGEIAAGLARTGPATAARIDLLSYRPNSLEFRFDAPTPGWLMVTDRWAPGWKVEVNGKPERVYGADFLFRAVKVDAGTNTIKFRYRPRGWLPSLIVSWGTLLLFLVVSVVRRLRN
jgi:Bacterial membrane protein YfhO